MTSSKEVRDWVNEKVMELISELESATADTVATKSNVVAERIRRLVLGGKKKFGAETFAVREADILGRLKRLMKTMPRNKMSIGNRVMEGARNVLLAKGVDVRTRVYPEVSGWQKLAGSRGFKAVAGASGALALIAALIAQKRGFDLETMQKKAEYQLATLPTSEDIAYQAMLPQMQQKEAMTHRAMLAKLIGTEEEELPQGITEIGG